MDKEHRTNQPTTIEADAVEHIEERAVIAPSDAAVRHTTRPIISDRALIQALTFTANGLAG
jgi:hypothetical protein